MSDYERIYLQPECCADPTNGRLWCKDDAPEDCDDGVGWTEYVNVEKYDRLRQRVAELEADVERYRTLWQSIDYDPDLVRDCLKDAERYRWLLKQRWVTWAPIGQAFDGGASGVELDAAIDAAMADPDDDFTRGEHDL